MTDALHPLPRRPRVAVVGSGVAGLTAAYACSAAADVTLVEADDRLGGHADTHDVVEDGRTLGIDTGFIVHNRLTYPTLLALFEELGVETQPSEMSMSIVDELTGLEWAGARGIRGVLPTWERVRDRDHLRMLAEIPRFHRAARRHLAAIDARPEDAEGQEDLTTLGDFLDRHGFSPTLRHQFVEPLIAAVWSCDPKRAGDYPASYLFRFLAHHRMLTVTGSPTWRTVTGGSRAYVDKLAARLRERGGEILLSSPVDSVRERAHEVEVTLADGTAREFDRIVIATHPHQALAMLAEPTGLQREVLGAITYSSNPAVLHTDQRVMPSSDSVRSSWNFRRRLDDDGRVTVTYDLTRLQRLPTTTRYLVTLGGSDLIDPATVIAEMDYEHPLYTPESVAAQRRLPEIETERILFAGAYHGWGFHEDGARSGAEAAGRLGLSGLAARSASSASSAPEVFETDIEHVRRKPWRRRFRHRSYLWVVDLDALPPHSWLRGSIEARDHLGDPARPIRDNLAAFLAGEGIELGDAMVRLAAHPRAWGHCFNPISVFWCTASDGRPLATVVEVHNTYGDRHAYLLRPGEGEVEKQMYVSPFHGVDGTYDVTARRTDDTLDVAIRLRTADGARFSASMTGRRVERRRLRALAAGPRDALLIRLHGIVLWLRRLPIQPRPTHHQEGVR
ncbi:MAG: DUF1365 family protein [Nocardioides sp.]|uniref:FAD-dependent oxidoreductase n=1 Tax=Nocardioides sp. TaxID=35761 RepID=UPI0039E3A9FF